MARRGDLLELVATPRSGGVGPDNGAGFTDASCVSYYRTIRADVPPSAAQIGYGVNKLAPARTVRRWLAALHTDLLRDRVTDYTTPEDLRDRALVAQLAAEYLGLPGLDPDQVAFCNGTTEAISITLGFAGRRDMRAVLPLPLYCSFEQSAARHGVPVVGHYNATGHLAGPGAQDGHLLAVDIAPNGVTGSWFAGPPAHLGEPELRVVDHVFALPAYQSGQEFLATLRGRVRDLSRTAVFLTPSKDLSIPGLRCGTLITGHAGLAAYARADRFERGYATQVGLGRVAAVHLALLLLAFAPVDRQAAVRDRVRAAFAAAGLPFPSDRECVAFTAHLAGMRRRFTGNIRRFDGTGCLVPLGGVQVAGYSGFRRLDRPFGSAAAYTEWIHAAGLAGLKLNPNLLFGADAARWEQLYPGGHGIRVNFSVPPGQLATDLTTLLRLLP